MLQFRLHYVMKNSIIRTDNNIGGYTMSELLQGTALLKGNKNLAIELVEMGLPSKLTIDKMNADLNEDLLGNNKYSKGKKEFLGVNTFRRLLNEAFDAKWSWEVLSYQLMPSFDKPEYALVIGRLYLPGLGFRDGIGSAVMDKKDNSAAFAIAGSNAFKNALKQSGFGASLLDGDWDEELFDEDFEEDEEDEEEEVVVKKKAPTPKPTPKPAPKEEKKIPAPKEGSEDNSPTKEQKEGMAELREIYNIENNKQLLGFMQIWKPELKSLKGVGRKELSEFLTYYDENEDEFEDFDPEEVE